MDEPKGGWNGSFSSVNFYDWSSLHPSIPKPSNFCGSYIDSHTNHISCKEVHMDELNKLENWLKDNGYHYISKPKFSGGIVVVNDSDGNYLWDAVWHEFSYGHEKGLLEVMGEAILDHDDVEGYLTCEDIVQKIKEHNLLPDTLAKDLMLSETE